MNFKNSTIENGKQIIDKNYRKNQEQIERTKIKRQAIHLDKKNFKQKDETYSFT